MADIAKMYRQINIAESQRHLQRIVWRADKNEELKQFRLNTVTYGTASASFLVTRCLQQVALDNIHSFPAESKILMKDFYVDNLMTGSERVEQARVLIKNIHMMMSRVGFNLRQWMSNCPIVLKDITKGSNVIQFIISETNQGNALGLTWDRKTDEFVYVAQLETNTQEIRKRQILSVISKIFDPLGLVGPVVVTAKILLQQLWKLNLGWDETVPIDLQEQFTKFTAQLKNLSSIAIPRKLLLTTYKCVQIHGFCDASMSAYGACIYIRSQNANGEVSVRLACSKSRVSPIKTITVPRLELCSAVLLCELINQVERALDMNINNIFYWSDSTIVLAWIQTDPSTLKTFVSNRIVQIQRLTKGEWNHISTTENPADLVSRGATPMELKNSKLWWEGPNWLTQIDMPKPNKHNIDTENKNKNIPEIKQHAAHSLMTLQAESIFSKYSCYTKLVRVISYIFRFYNNCKGTQKITGNLTMIDLSNTVIKLVKLVQTSHFPNEMKSLKKPNPLNDQNKLSSLSPFIDQNGLIRVGGRLQKSNLNHSQKHQLILPAKHPFTSLLIKHEHHRNLHAGAQAVLSSLRQNCWIINGRQTVRSVLRRCITCFRADPFTLSQKMGQLPSARVTPGRVFSSVGIDYAGPFDLKDGKTRNRIIVKAYICIFVCLATKAVHMELVGDLTSASFLNCLKRFVSRRGICTLIMSDNATNFVGANHNLIKIMSHASVQSYAAENSIQWKFIPARSPHFSGLWEASVKSAKYYLKRLLNGSHLTYEEFYTLLTQIEAIMNSRPLIPLSSDPNDLEPLTPRHFIMGRPPNALPQAYIEDNVPMNRLSRYLHLQKMTQQFWKRWSKDYLQHPTTEKQMEGDNNERNSSRFTGSVKGGQPTSMPVAPGPRCGTTPRKGQSSACSECKDSK